MKNNEELWKQKQEQEEQAEKDELQKKRNWKTNKIVIYCGLIFLFFWLFPILSGFLSENLDIHINLLSLFPNSIHNFFAQGGFSNDFITNHYWFPPILFILLIVSMFYGLYRFILNTYTSNTTAMLFLLIAVLPMMIYGTAGFLSDVTKDGKVYSWNNIKHRLNLDKKERQETVQRELWDQQQTLKRKQAYAGLNRLEAQWESEHPVEFAQIAKWHELFEQCMNTSGKGSYEASNICTPQTNKIIDINKINASLIEPSQKFRELHAKEFKEANDAINKINIDQGRKFTPFPN